MYTFFVYGGSVEKTIRVEEDTLAMLKQLKAERHARSYDEVVSELIRHEQERISMFGADEDLKRWKDEDRLGLGEDRG